MNIRKKLWSVILSITLALATVVCPMQVAAAEEGIPIDEEHFPDLVFRAHIIENYDKNEDMELSKAEANEVIKLDLNGLAESYQGIEYFPNLEMLICTNIEQISYLEDDLDVSNNPKLRVLSCPYTSITSLDVSNNPNLEQLDCSATGITSLDVSHNPNLEMLWCTNTKITSLDLENNIKLKDLACSGTNIKRLDLRNNSMLQSVVCECLDLTSLDLSGNPALQELYCAMTNLTNLDLSKNSLLITLSCWDTKLTSLDISRNPELQFLDCGETPITNLDISNNIKLEVLQCTSTKLSDLNVSYNVMLKELFCHNTNISSLDLTANTKLDTLHIIGCPLISLLVPAQFNGSVDEPSPYKLVLQPGEDSVDLKTIAPSIQAGRILDLKGCKKQGTVLTGLKAGQTITYRYDYNGGSINVTIEVSESSGQPESPENPLQKPIVSSGEGYTTELLEDGTMVAITVKDGYTLEDVKVNGISRGKVTLIYDLKTGDTVDITVSKNETPEPVYDLSDAVVTIPADSYAYTGKYIKPVPTVMYDGKKLKKGVDYTVSYSNHKKIGEAEVMVTGVGEYSGSETLEFKIIPRKVALSSVKSTGKKSITVKWKKVPQATGYQVQWRKSSKFSSSLSKKVKGTSITSTKIKKLSSKKKYYVRVRAYKVVNGKTYYGKWSTVKTTKVK